MQRPLAALPFALLIAAGASGTTLSNETTLDLIVAADRVCCGVVERVEARRDPRSGFVFTHVKVRLLEEMKGAGDAPVLELRLPGGRADGVETSAPGMPRFEAGAEAVLLLGKKNRDGFPVVLQASGGVLPLRAGEDGRRTLRARVTGLRELEGQREVSIDSFRAAVKRVLREHAERQAKQAGEPAKPGGDPAGPGKAAGDGSAGQPGDAAGQPGEPAGQPGEPAKRSGEAAGRAGR